MIVDGSYEAWVRPTRRVHFALSVGMTLTGVILIAAGTFGGPSAAPLSPALGRAADSVVSGGDGTPGSLVPPAPLVPLVPLGPLTSVAPPVTATPSATPPGAKAKPKPKSKHHAKPRPHHRHATPTPPPSRD